MKVEFTKSRTLPIGISCGYLLKSALTLVILFVYLNASAQGTSGSKDPVPVATIKGGGIGLVNGSHVFITAEVFAGPNATVTFSIGHNASGASIVSQGTYVYDSSTGKGTQIVEIAPGSVQGNFYVKAAVSNGSGQAEATMTAAAVDKN